MAARMASPAVVAAWPGLLDELIDKVIANRDLFLLHQRNERPSKSWSTATGNNAAARRPPGAVPPDPREPRDPARPAGADGRLRRAVFGALMAAGGVFGDDVS